MECRMEADPLFKQEGKGEARMGSQGVHYGGYEPLVKADRAGKQGCLRSGLWAAEE